MKCVQDQIDDIFHEDQFDDEWNDELIQTIRCPKNIAFLTDKLPKPLYASSAEETKYI